MNNIEYIDRTIRTDVPSGASQGYFIVKLRSLGATPTDDQLRALMNEIVGNSPQSFRMAQRFGPNTDPVILALFTPGGSINAAPGDNGMPFLDLILEQHAVNGEIDLVSEIRAVGNLYSVFPIMDGMSIKNSLSDILGDFSKIKLDGNQPSFEASLSSLIGTSPIATGSSTATITSVIGDMSLVSLDGLTSADSISVVIGPSPIGAATTITGAIGNVDDVKLDGITPIPSIAAAIGQNVALSKDVPVKTNLISAINSVAAKQKDPYALSAFCIEHNPGGGGSTAFASDMIAIMRKVLNEALDLGSSDDISDCILGAVKAATAKITGETNKLPELCTNSSPPSSCIQTCTLQSFTDTLLPYTYTSFYQNKDECVCGTENYIYGTISGSIFATAVNQVDIRTALAEELCARYDS